MRQICMRVEGSEGKRILGDFRAAESTLLAQFGKAGGGLLGIYWSGIFTLSTHRSSFSRLRKDFCLQVVYNKLFVIYDVNCGKG
jgi:hypothetical protein